MSTGALRGRILSSQCISPAGREPLDKSTSAQLDQSDQFGARWIHTRTRALGAKARAGADSRAFFRTVTYLLAESNIP
jgi:hypothetical protein